MKVFQMKIGYTLNGPHGVINPYDSTNYIRLTKSFPRPESFEILTKDPNNLYFYQASVKIDGNSAKGYPIKTLNFEKSTYRSA